jgi:hypothetical protein
MASSIIYKERETPTPYLLSTKLATSKRNTRTIAPASPAIPLATLGSDKPLLFQQEDAVDTLQKWNTPYINM